MKSRLTTVLHATVLVMAAIWLVGNVTTSIWYGMVSLDWAGTMDELPRWTNDKAIEQLTRLQPAPRHESIISDASNDIVSREEAPFFTGTPLFFVGPFLGPYGLGGTGDIGDAWSRPLRIASVRAALTKVVDQHNRFYKVVSLVGESSDGQPYTDNFLLDQRLRNVTLHPENFLLLESLNPTLFNVWEQPPAVSGKIRLRPYTRVHDFLVYVPSERGVIKDLHAETRLWRFEQDFIEPGKSMEAVGRYLLFNVVNPTTPFRLELSLTVSLMTGNRTTIPPAAVVGTGRFPLAAVGNGAARFFSPPITAQTVQGMSYIELDLGRDGAPFPDRRRGIIRLYGMQVRLDRRKITGFIRDVSIVSESQYRSLRAPRALTSFPGSLEDPNLEFSGLYEDGWMADRAAIWLSAPARGPGTLTLRAMVPHQTAEKPMEIAVSLDGRIIDEVRPAPGELVLHEPVIDDGRRHEVRLTVDRTFRLPNGDGRPASMLIEYLGFDGNVDRQDIQPAQANSRG
jgi:hypothetical protein